MNVRRGRFRRSAGKLKVGCDGYRRARGRFRRRRGTLRRTAESSAERAEGSAGAAEPYESAAEPVTERIEGSAARTKPSAASAMTVTAHIQASADKTKSSEPAAIRAIPELEATARRGILSALVPVCQCSGTMSRGGEQPRSPPPGREVQDRAARVLHRGLLENGSAELPVTSRHTVLRHSRRVSSLGPGGRHATPLDHRLRRRRPLQ